MTGTALVDTDVLVDFRRGTPAARAWLPSMAAGAFQVPVVVAMELVVGCREKHELRSTHRFLERFEIAYPSQAELELALALVSQHHLSSGLGIPDATVAAMAIGREVRLLTFNLKHFRAIANLQAEAPYQR